MQSLFRLGTACTLLFVPGLLQLHAQNPAGDLQNKLNSEFTLTKITADRSDIVTAGSVLVLHKDGLLMYTTDTAIPPLNVYRDGRIQQAVNWGGLGHNLLHNNGGQIATNTSRRSFVSGEKFWLTKIDFVSDGVIFDVYSDPYNDVRYYGQIKFPFAKGAMPPADAMMHFIDEVVTVQPADNASQGQGAPPPASPPPGVPSAPASPADMAPIAPPPPPGDAAPPPSSAGMAPPAPPADQPAAGPKTISIGQSKNDVIGILGQPSKDVKLGAKEILVYPDMKVTLVNGKVSDVQ